MATQPERRKADRRSTAIPRDEHELLLAYRRAKALKHAELNVAIQEALADREDEITKTIEY